MSSNDLVLRSTFSHHDMESKNEIDIKYKSMAPFQICVLEEHKEEYGDERDNHFVCDKDTIRKN